MAETESAARARAVWSAGDFDRIAQRIAGVGEHVTELAAIAAGERVLDVACGSGNATIPAAQRGAQVTGLDIVPELLESGRRHAADAGVEVEWVEGDAQELPFDGESFDVVVSTFGCMFAPDHRRAAAEIVRVLAPGGRIAIAAWRPEGAIGEFFKTIASHSPPPPEGFQPPPLWGVRDHVDEIFAGTGIDLRYEEAFAEFRFDSVDQTMDEFSNAFGPIVTLRRALEPEGRWEQAAADLRALFERLDIVEGPGFGYDGAYLVTLGERS